MRQVSTAMVLIEFLKRSDRMSSPLSLTAVAAGAICHWCFSLARYFLGPIRSLSEKERHSYLYQRMSLVGGLVTGGEGVDSVSFARKLRNHSECGEKTSDFDFPMSNGCHVAVIL